MAATTKKAKKRRAAQIAKRRAEAAQEAAASVSSASSSAGAAEDERDDSLDEGGGDSASSSSEGGGTSRAAKRRQKLKPKDPSESLKAMERPTIKWKIIAQIVGAFVVLWVTAAMMIPYVGYWGLGVVGVLSLVAIGFGIYIWRLTRRSQEVVDILQNATDAEGRKEAIEKLKEDPNDAMKALARAQLVGQENPAEAMRILEGIDLEKAPAVVQDDVRANLAFMYLVNNRKKDARTLVDELRLDRQPNAKAKAMYAAVSAETFARTGDGEEAQKLLETYDPADPEFGEVRGMLLRARIYTYLALKKKGRAKSAMVQLAQVDPNQLAAFLQRGARPEVRKLAEEALRGEGLAPRAKMKTQRR